MPSLAGEKSEEGRETIVLACRREARELTPLPQGRGVGAALSVEHEMWPGRRLGKFTPEEEQQLSVALITCGADDWRRIQGLYVPSRSCSEIQAFAQRHLSHIQRPPLDLRPHLLDFPPGLAEPPWAGARVPAPHGSQTQADGADCMQLTGAAGPPPALYAHSGIAALIAGAAALLPSLQPAASSAAVASGPTSGLDAAAFSPRGGSTFGPAGCPGDPYPFSLALRGAPTVESAVAGPPAIDARAGPPCFLGGDGSAGHSCGASVDTAAEACAHAGGGSSNAGASGKEDTAQHCASGLGSPASRRGGQQLATAAAGFGAGQEGSPRRDLFSLLEERRSTLPAQHPRLRALQILHASTFAPPPPADRASVLAERGLAAAATTAAASDRSLHLTPPAHGKHPSTAARGVAATSGPPEPEAAMLGSLETWHPVHVSREAEARGWSQRDYQKHERQLIVLERPWGGGERLRLHAWCATRTVSLYSFHPRHGLRGPLDNSRGAEQRWATLMATLDGPQTSMAITPEPLGGVAVASGTDSDTDAGGAHSSDNGNDDGEEVIEVGIAPPLVDPEGERQGGCAGGEDSSAFPPAATFARPFRIRVPLPACSRSSRGQGGDSDATSSDTEALSATLDDGRSEGTAERETRLRANNSQVYCLACGSGEDGEDNDILLCDGEGCFGAYHLLCLHPPLQAVPPGEWFCPRCIVKQSQRGAPPGVGAGAQLPPRPLPPASQGLDPQSPVASAATRGESDMARRNHCFTAEEDATILRLRLFEGRGFDEVARALGRTYASVKKRHQRLKTGHGVHSESSQYGEWLAVSGPAAASDQAQRPTKSRSGKRRLGAPRARNAPTGKRKVAKSAAEKAAGAAQRAAIKAAAARRDGERCAENAASDDVLDAD